MLFFRNVKVRFSCCGWPSIEDSNLADKTQNIASFEKLIVFSICLKFRQIARLFMCVFRENQCETTFKRFVQEFECVDNSNAQENGLEILTKCKHWAIP